MSDLMNQAALFNNTFPIVCHYKVYCSANYHSIWTNKFS